MRAFLRMVVAPAALACAATLTFHRAFALGELVGPVALAVLLGLGAGWVVATRRVPWPLGLVALAAAAGGGAAVLDGSSPTLGLVPDAFALFLTVGLPARGLDRVALVPFVVLVLAVAAAVAASMRHRTLATLAGPLAAVAVAALLVAPVGFAVWVPVAFALAAAAVLMLDARGDLSQLPSLVGTNTEARRQLGWWRPLVQIGPAVLVLIGLLAVLPRGTTLDVRRYVSPPTERLADANPLALAARAPQLSAEEAGRLAAVRVAGQPPGRMRLAVLDLYSATGWRQSADFSITGETLAEDPVYALVERPGDERLAPALSTVVVDRTGAPALFRAVPTAGTPETVADPDGVRFSARAGVLLTDDRTSSVRYRTQVRGLAAPGPDLTVGQFPPELARCPASPLILSIAQQLTAGVVATAERLDRIENYLKVRRVYDPGAPGGQTIRSVERFLEQDYARGNLEVFVTSYALLARCAGVPVRVVVGLPEPARGETIYTRRDVTAWVETPLTRSGWAPRDPLPTPDEQLQQAQLARQQLTSPPPPEPATKPQAVPFRVVEPRPITPDDRRAWLRLVPLGVVGLALAAGALWALVVPARVLAWRRRTRDPSAAVHAAWVSVTDALVDRDLGIDDHHTPHDVVRLATGRLPVTLPRLLQGMAPLVDRVRYSGHPAGDADAGLAWGYAAAILERLPSSWRVRLAPVLHPRRAWGRLVGALRTPRRRARWHAPLPETAVVSTSEAPGDIPEVTIEARIGEGSTGTVYRGVLAPGGEHVAVKVFRYGPGDVGFDAQRFEWEVRVARQVSGLPHLPIVHAAGITPTSNRPYLVSSLYEDGTLLDRVRRGGPMTQSEAVAIGMDVATALICLHQLGVVHADVKPENVFAGPDGWVLGDLGSAWLRASRGPAASLTPPYAAPEVWRGSAPTPLADLYSLGLTMLFAVTGQVPIASISPSRDDVAAAFPDHPVLLRVLEPDTRRRPRSVSDLARQLRPDLAATPAGARLRALSLPTPTVSHGRR